MVKVRRLDEAGRRGAAEVSDDQVTIAEIAKQLKLDPKVARARLRKLKNVPATIDQARWSWRQAQVDRVKALLKDDA